MVIVTKNNCFNQTLLSCLVVLLLPRLALAAYFVLRNNLYAVFLHLSVPISSIIISIISIITSISSIIFPSSYLILYHFPTT